jgi:DNA-binding MarR family transcriptional regulator
VLEPTVAEGRAEEGPAPPGSLPGDGLGVDGLPPDVEDPDGVSLAGLPEAERRRVLVAETARFASAFLRWIEGRACGGLTYGRLRLLQALHCGGPAIMRDLGDQLGVSPRNMTAMVDALEDAKLVVRRPHPTDRRATLVELSPSGNREAEQALEPQLDAMAELFGGFSAAEQQAFTDALARLGRAIQDRQGDC